MDNSFRNNTMLAMVAQGILESVNDYGLRVAGILKKITEFIEDPNTFEISKAMIISIQNTAKGNFIVGLWKELALRIRLENLETLQDSVINLQSKDLKNEKGNFMVNTGDELKIIKYAKLKHNIYIQGAPSRPSVFQH